MVNQVSEIEDLTLTRLKTVQITFPQIVGQLIKLVDPRHDPLSLQLSMVGLTIFRKIIEKENADKFTPAADWCLDDYALYEKKIRVKQDELVDLGLMDVICSMIGMNTHMDLKTEAILVGISLLLGGNAKAQSSLLKYLQQDSRNELILTLGRIIDQNVPIVKRYCDRLNRQRELEQQQ